MRRLGFCRTLNGFHLKPGCTGGKKRRGPSLPDSVSILSEWARCAIYPARLCLDYNHGVRFERLRERRVADRSGRRSANEVSALSNSAAMVPFIRSLWCFLTLGSVGQCKSWRPMDRRAGPLLPSSASLLIAEILFVYLLINGRNGHEGQ